MSTNDPSTNESPSKERFLVDSDCDPELVDLLRKVGFRAKSVLSLKIPNDDTAALIWARKNGYILVCHDKHRDAKTRYSFYSEMYYRGGQLIRIGGKPGQSPHWALGKILAQGPTWQDHFRQDSGQAVVHPSGCNFTPAAKLFERSRYDLRLPFEDPAVPLKSRVPLAKERRRKRKSPPIEQMPLEGSGAAA